MDVICKVRHSWTLEWKEILVILTIVGTANGTSCSWSVYAPSTVSGIQGRSVNLSCSFTISNGAAHVYRVTWTTSSNNLTRTYAYSSSYLNNNTWGQRASLTGQASLRLQSVTQQDSGLYTCKIRLLSQTSCSLITSNSERRDYTRLVVRVPPSAPRISTSPSGAINRDVVEGTTAYLYCENIGGSGQVTYTWRRGGQVLYGSMESGKNKLTITNIKRYTATYTCTVSNSAGTNSATFTFNVILPPSAPRISTSPSGAINRDVVEGTTAYLYCVNIGGSTPVTYTWRRGGQVLSGTMERGKYKLTITNIKRYTATYTCTVRNVAGTNSASFTFNVILPPSVPRITTSSSGAVNRDIVEDSTAFLYCENVGGSDPVTYTWRRGSQVLSSSTRIGKYMLTITNIKRGAGTFTCSVANTAGTNSATFTFNVLYPSGSALAVSTQVVKVIGNIASLQCRVTQQGNPTVTFRWTKDSASTMIATNTGTLYKSNLQVSDEGTYNCTPVNTAGSGAPASVVLTVNVPPRISPAVPSVMTVRVSQDLRLECTATAKPAASLQWTMSTGAALPSAVFETENPPPTVNGKITTSKSILKWKSGSSASTRKSAGNEVGVKCTAYNGVGNRAEDHSRVVIQYPPGTPKLTISSLSPQINTTVTLTCSVPHAQGGNPATYTYTVKKGSAVISTSHSNIFTMRVYDIRDAVGYACEVRNSVGAGSSPSRTQTIAVVNVPAFIHNPLAPQTITPFYSDPHFKLECIFSGNPTPADDTLVWNKDGAGIVDLTKYTVTTVQVTQSFPYGISVGKKSMITWNKSFGNFSCDSVAEYDGKYQCSVNSGTPEQDMSSEVTVRTKYPPELRGLHNVLVAAKLRDTKTIVCNVCAYPPPKSYTWYFGNETNSRGSGQNLTISDIQINDFGTYICKVINEVGEESIDFELKPDGPPEPPVSMTATEVTSRTIIVKWVPGYDGGYPQFFVVRYKKVSEDDTAYQSLEDIPQGNRQELSAILQNLNASTPYRISIQAKNTRPQLPNASRRIEGDFTTADLPSVVIQSVVYSEEYLTVVWELQKGNPINYTVQYRRAGDAVFRDLATDIPASQNNVTVAISLKEGNYEFRIIAHEGESVPFETQLEPRMFELRTENTVSVAVGVTVAVFILAISSTVVTFFFKRRRRKKTDNELTEEDVTEISEIPRVREGAYETPQKNIEVTSVYTSLHKDKKTISRVQEGEYEKPQKKIEETSVYTSLHKGKKTVDAVTTYPVAQPCDTEIPRKYVRLIGKIGNGASGRNLKGEIYDLHGKRVWTPVAVKTVKDLEDAAIVEYLLDELKVMQALRPHPNVISLLGSCTGEGGLPMIILEYLPNGNLQSFLRNVRSRNKGVYDNLYGTGSSLTTRDLMGFALDVANGMAHLSSLSILHRDLAARNVLLADGRKCKIAGFGFATNDIENHPYDRKSQGRLPVRWMSPEALFDNKFTTQSDVWAYGVLLWEIVAMGSKPYSGMSAKKVMKALTEGYRMSQPPHCSPDMYNIMLSCWEEKPTARPSFDEITNSWKGLLDYEVLTFEKTEKVTV
ncbi:hemicentin-1 isoform X2 [Lingula anatina]|uniref:receptor protein-tyrosine kinase n=1 Tax=Lingula anatina TaxID=7574 RepID=A0A1S3HWI1_LINAN|nr:hemicentin-1 isoform X2 [Lingula anatina]|eukprot:XP_013389419.1 hemicentin-1 isoform X2 [Lingula anatina]